MRKSFWVGLVLVVLGLIVALSGPTYNEQQLGISGGSARVEIQERGGLMSWAGWAGAGLGLVLMISSLRERGAPSRTFDEHRPHTP